MPCAVISNFEKKTAKTARELSTFPKNAAVKSVQYAQKNLTTIQEISIVNVGNKKRRVNTIKITLKQIAARCGVSTNTVSLALRGMSGISEKTRKRIESAAYEMGYFEQKNAAAGKQNLVLIASRRHLQDSYFYMRFYQMVAGCALKHGYNLIVLDEKSMHQDPYAFAGQIADNSARGILLLGDMMEESVKKVCMCGLPVVSIGTHYPGLSIDTVMEDNDAVSRLAMQHLAAAGCRSVSFVGQPDYSTAFSQRYFSYLAAASQLPVETPDDMLIGRPDKEMNELIAELTQRIGARETLPDAFYCANDYIAIMLIRALTTQGISIPEQVSIIGVDNNPVSALVSPQLCSLDIQCGKQAHYALRRMTELLHDKTSEPVRLLIQPRLIPGASVQHA